MKTLDMVDKKILRELCADARIPNAQLAERVHLTPTPCLRRVRKLEAKGIVKGYRPDLDNVALGYRVTALVFVKLSRYSEHNARLFETAAKALSAITECAVVAGRFDYVLKVVARDLPDYERILKDALSGIEVIEDLESTIILKQVDCSDTLPF